MQEQTGYGIRIVARRSGLTPHVSRIWEKRYSAVKPFRTATNRRLYSENDVERLSMLRKLTLAGHSIGTIAKLPSKQLATLVEQAGGLQPAAMPHPPATAADFRAQCIEAIQQFDAELLEAILGKAAVALGQIAVAQDVIMPMMYEIGEQWRDGRLRVLHEHLASAVVRTFLGSISSSYQPSSTAPAVLTATPAGQIHEFGALMATATALSEGWRAIYLGPNLPAEEIAGAAERGDVDAIALSIVYPGDDPQISKELLRLRKYLSRPTPILIGGRASESYASTLSDMGAIRVADLQDLRRQLELLRSSGR